MPWTGFASAALGAAGSIAGGLFGNKGGGHSRQWYLDQDFRQYQRQLQYTAENQPSFLVEGAKRAGLHPLAVLGMPLTQGTTTSIGGMDSAGGRDYSWLSDAGQHIGRAAGALLSKDDRAKQQQYDETRQAQQLRNNDLQNKLLSRQIDQITQDMALQLARNSTRAVDNSAQNPGFQLGIDGRTTHAVIPGQNDAATSRLFTLKPPEVAVSHPQTAFAEAGTHPELKFVRTALGGYSPVRSQALEESLEDDRLGMIRFNIRNGIGSAISHPDFAPPKAYLPDKGKSGRYQWMFDPWIGEWYPWDRQASFGQKFKNVFPFGRFWR